MPDNNPNKTSESQVMHAMSVDDAYRVVRVLAKGIGGITELVTIDNAGPFVRKKIPLDQARRSVWAMLSDCRSPFLPRVRATYEMPDWFVVVHDYVPGETLERRICQHGPLAPHNAAQTILDICEAAGDLHAHNVVHRDITPANVILAADGAHLIDFGIARLSSEAATGVTTPYGTWGFAAPEQFGFDGKGTDPRSDVYSIGRLLGFALTGVNPAADDKRFAALLNDGTIVPLGLRSIIGRACSFEPSARYQSAYELADDLKRWAEPATPAPATYKNTDSESTHSTSTASGDTPKTTGPLLSRKRPALPIIALSTAIGLMAIAVLIALFVLPGPHSESPSESASPDASRPDSLSDIVTDAILQDRSESGNADSLSPAVSVADLEIVESGWSRTSDGYVHYAFGVRNPNESFDAWLPQISISGKAENGTVLFADTQVLSYIPAGETVYYAGHAESASTPSMVEFAPLPLDELSARHADTGIATLALSNLSIAPDSFYEFKLTGEASLSQGTLPPSTSSIAVTIVFRDASGAIVGGSTSFANLPGLGSSIPFEATSYVSFDHASFDAYIQFW